MNTILWYLIAAAVTAILVMAELITRILRAPGRPTTLEEIEEDIRELDE